MKPALDFKNPDWFAEEDINIFRDAAFEFYSRECAPHSERWREQGIVDRETWNLAGKMGMLCTSIPEEYGGGGGDYRHEMIVMEEMIRAKVDGFGISLHNAIVAPYILHYGTEEQKRNWLPRMATGELVGAIAMTEPGTGSDLQGVKTRARKSGNGYVLNGSKTFITNGGTANLIIVVAKTGEEDGAKGVSLMVVETDGADGFKRGRNLDKIGGHAQDTSELFFEDVQGDLWNPTSVVQILDTVRAFFNLPQTPGFSLEKANLKIKLVPDCSGGPCSGGPLTVDYTMHQVADTSCSCVSIIGCGSITVNVHCGICPADCQDGGLVFTGFDSQRLNYGLPDNNDDGLPDGFGSIDMTKVRTKYLMLRDTLFTRFHGYVDTTAANPTWAEGFAQSTITRGNVLTAVSYEVRIVDASTNTVYTCPLAAPTIVTMGTTRSFSYDLDTAALSGCLPPGFVYEVDDSVEVTAIYVVSANPGGIVQGQTITNVFAL
ncbi:MAG: acyl-CoA dehydrogenase family protein, partial [Robiginitomaculum sp.]|nr:acyl-CoA dehydrogenase family protein [Robiginitomaculum sp.]